MNKILVCDKEFSVEFVDGWKRVSHDPDNCPRHAAEISWMLSNIRVDASRKRSDVEISLWHEVVHAIAETLKIKGLDPGGEGDFESATEQMAVGLHSVMKSVGLSLLDAVKENVANED